MRPLRILNKKPAVEKLIRINQPAVRQEKEVRKNLTKNQTHIIVIKGANNPPASEGKAASDPAQSSNDKKAEPKAEDKSASKASETPKAEDKPAAESKDASDSKVATDSKNASDKAASERKEASDNKQASDSRSPTENKPATANKPPAATENKPNESSGAANPGANSGAATNPPSNNTSNNSNPSGSPSTGTPSNNGSGNNNTGSGSNNGNSGNGGSDGNGSGSGTSSSEKFFKDPHEWWNDWRKRMEDIKKDIPTEANSKDRTSEGRRQHAKRYAEAIERIDRDQRERYMRNNDWNAIRYMKAQEDRLNALGRFIHPLNWTTKQCGAGFLIASCGEKGQ